MTPAKTNLLFVLWVLVVIGAIVANEVGLGFISLILLFPAAFLMQKIFGNSEPGK